MTVRRAIGKAADVGKGFVENVFTDAYDLLKGLYQIIPTTAKGIVGVVRDRQHLGQAITGGEVTRSLGDTAVAMRDAVIEPYQKHGVGVLYHRPVTTLLDAMTVFSLGAGAASKALRVAAPGSKAAIAAARFETLPGRLVRQAIDKTVKKTTGFDLAKRRKYLEYKRVEFGQIPERVANDMDAVGRQVAGLSDDETALWHEARTMGATKEELAARPSVAKALESYRALVEGEWQPFIKGEGLLDDVKMRSALERKFVVEAIERKIPGFDRINRTDRKSTPLNST